MNSLYKKIVLTCLVSLTANQAVHAFQFADMWDWVKKNQTATVLIVAAIALSIPGYNLFKSYKRMQAYRRADANEKRGAFTYKTYLNTSAYDTSNGRGEQILMPDAQLWLGLSQEDRRILGAQYQVDWDKWHEPLGKQVYVAVARDEQNEIAGAIFYETEGGDSPICITHWHGQEGTVKAGLFKPLIKTGKDIKAQYKEGLELGACYRDVQAEILQDDVVKPRKNILWSEKAVLFDRSEARTRKLLSERES